MLYVQKIAEMLIAFNKREKKIMAKYEQFVKNEEIYTPTPHPCDKGHYTYTIQYLGCLTNAIL